MAESNITKQALANGLKELMAVHPFEKISIGQICDKCHMSRQSFYYHFKDKYDLINWICDEDFAPVFLISDEENRWIVIEEICRIFYKNKTFYQCALQISGQNSMTDHIREIMIPSFHARLKDILQQQNSDALPETYAEFYIHLFSDIFLCCINRWILDKNDIPPEALLAMLHTFTTNVTPAIIQQLAPDAPISIK